MKKTREQDQ